jgi:hypothetical protein
MFEKNNFECPIGPTLQYSHAATAGLFTDHQSL